MSMTTKLVDGTGGWLDDRFRGAKGFRTAFRKIFPDHWTFLLGEIALYSFIILLLTGTFLTFWSVLPFPGICVCFWCHMMNRCAVIRASSSPGISSTCRM